MQTSQENNNNDFVFCKQLFLSIKQEDPSNYYDIQEKEIGKGAFGKVYRGKLIGTQGPYRAIKKINKYLVPNHKMMLEEIQIMSTLDHPLIIKIYDIFDWKSDICIVQDFCDGGQLFDQLQQVGLFSQQTARVIFQQMIQSLNYIHLQKIAHRDLKPQNFLFLSKNSLNLKLIDFGLAYRWEDNMKNQIRRKGQRRLVGTSYYLSPQVASFIYDERCDIWSAGVILYMSVSGTPPFDGESDKQIIQKVKKIDYTFDIPQFQNISSELKDLISRIFVKDTQRITIAQIFQHPWMMKTDIPKIPLKINFSKMAQYSKFSKLKKLSAIYIASQRSQKQVEGYGQIFKQINSNKNGCVSLKQIKMALEKQKTSTNLNEIEGTIETNQDRTFYYTQFLASVMDKEQIFSQQNMRRIFQKLDMNGNGSIERADLLNLFQQTGIQQYNGKSISFIVDQIWKSCGNYQEDGKITFQKFKTSMLQ